MPKKIRELKQLVSRAGWIEIAGGGKGSHTKWAHPRVSWRVTLAGGDGDDAERYQDADVKSAVREAEKGN